MKVPILLPNIFNHPFTYESDINLKVGDYVVVPFGKSKITGVVNGFLGKVLAKFPKRSWQNLGKVDYCCFVLAPSPGDLSSRIVG